MAKFNEYFITFSAPDLGGFSGAVKDSFEKELLTIFKDKYCFIVMEQYNRWKQNFPHYHIYVKYDTEIRKDAVHRTVKKSTEFEQLRKAYPYDKVKNALDIRVAHDKHLLLANYLTKQDEYINILDNLCTSLKDELLLKAKHKEENTYVLKGKKCPSLEELPYFIINYNNTCFQLDLSDHNHFKSVIKSMIREGYIMIKHIRNMRAVWTTCCVLEGDDYEFDLMIDKILEKDYQKIVC